MKAEAIRREALSLSVKERAELAAQLLSSLDALSEDEIAQLWLLEAARRGEEIDLGLTDRFRVELAPEICRHRVPGFPYSILYRTSGADVDVLVVAPHRRRPGYWLGRV